MSRIRLLLPAVALLSFCSIPSDEPVAEQTAAPAPVAKPADHSRRFASQDRVKIELVENHLMGKDFMPGGNVAEYSRGGKTYQQFVAEARNAEAAALLLFDYKADLTDANYLAHMGGYFGKDGDQPVLVFQKGKFVAGIVGLPEKEADLAAREFAAWLN